MSIPISTVGAVRNYLMTALAARPEMASPVLVCLDGPSTYLAVDIVSVGDIHRSWSTHGMVGGGGAGWLEESYTVEIVVDCFRGGDNASMVFSAAENLAMCVIDVVRLDPSLGGLVIQARPESSDTSSGWETAPNGARGRRSGVTLHIAIEALD